MSTTEKPRLLFAIDCRFTGPADAGRLVAQALSRWEVPVTDAPWLPNWRVTDVHASGRSLRFVLHAPVSKWERRHAGEFMSRLPFVGMGDRELQDLVPLAQYDIWRPPTA